MTGDGLLELRRRTTLVPGVLIRGELAIGAQLRAADAHDCIMVRIQTDLPHTSLAARSCAPMANSPRIHTPGQALSDAAAQEARLRSSSLRVLRRQGGAKTQATLSGKAAKLR